MTGLLAYWLRCCVAAAFVLSGGWKLRHRLEFAAVIAAITRRGRDRRLLRWLLPAAEAATAVLLLLPGALGDAGAAAAVLLTLALSGSLFLHDLSAGCGCWSSARTARGPLLARNGILLALAAASLLARPVVTWSSALVGLPAGTLFGLMIMELPTVRQYFLDAKGAPP